MRAKHSILPDFENRLQNMIKALFSVWAGEKKQSTPSLKAEDFYNRMTTFGLVPDVKFIEQVTNIVHSNRPKTNFGATMTATSKELKEMTSPANNSSPKRKKTWFQP